MSAPTAMTTLAEVATKPATRKRTEPAAAVEPPAKKPRPERLADDIRERAQEEFERYVPRLTKCLQTAPIEATKAGGFRVYVPWDETILPKGVFQEGSCNLVLLRNWAEKEHGFEAIHLRADDELKEHGIVFLVHPTRPRK